MHQDASKPGRFYSELGVEQDQVGPLSGADRAQAARNTGGARRVLRAIPNGLLQGLPRLFHLDLESPLERQGAAGKGAVFLPDHSVSQKYSGARETIASIVETTGLDGITDQDHPVFILQAVDELQGRRLDMMTIGDHLHRDPRVLEQGRDRARGTVMEPVHRVEKMRGVTNTAGNRSTGSFVIGIGVPESGHDPVFSAESDQALPALQLRRQGHRAHQAISGGQQLASLFERWTSKVIPRQSAGTRRGDKRPLEMDPEGDPESVPLADEAADPFKHLQ